MLALETFSTCKSKWVSRNLFYWGKKVPSLKIVNDETFWFWFQNSLVTLEASSKLLAKTKKKLWFLKNIATLLKVYHTKWNASTLWAKKSLTFVWMLLYRGCLLTLPYGPHHLYTCFCFLLLYLLFTVINNIKKTIPVVVLFIFFFIKINSFKVL